MTKSIRTLAASAALVALTFGPALAQNTKPAATAAPAKTESKAKPAHATWTKEQIKTAQAGLAKGGYYKGAPTGTWDKASQSAMKAWQKANKLPVNGHLSNDALSKLSM